jgi:plasmid stability protein
MASITVRKVDEKIKTKLRIRAALHGNSMENEIREILATAVEDQREPQPKEGLYVAMRRRLAEARIEGADLPESDRGPWRKGPDFGE